VHGNVAVVSLMEGVKTEEISVRIVGGGGAFFMPEDCWCIIVERVNDVRAEVAKLGEDVMVSDGAGELEIAVRDVSRQV
jgi:hypothetical protein